MSPTAGTACIACIACKGCLNRCAPLHLCTNAHSLQAQGFSPHGAQSSPDEASRATRTRGGRAGPVGYRHGSWGQWANGMGAGASLHRCAAPAPWGNTAQEKQLPHVKRELPELAAKGQNSQAASVREHRSSCNFCLYAKITSYICLIPFLLYNKSRSNECSTHQPIHVLSTGIQEKLFVQTLYCPGVISSLFHLLFFSRCKEAYPSCLRGLLQCFPLDL